MEEICCKFNLVIDFDSTFIKTEALDELAKIALEHDPNKEQKAREIEAITNKGMLGEISFPASLQSRLELFSVKQKHIDKLIVDIKENITKSFLDNKDFFKENNKNLYVISGGFLDYILPIVQDFGILPKNVLANKFIFENDKVVGVDSECFLAQDGGKTKAVEALKLKNITVVGDGWTDYEIRRNGGAEKFIAFSENVSRQKVVDVADIECFNFSEVIENLKKK